MFYRQPVGKYVVQVCRTLSCALKGAERVTEEMTDALHIPPGGTDSIRHVHRSSRSNASAPATARRSSMVNDGWHECLAPGDAVKLLDNVRAGGEAALSGCHHKVEKV